MPMIMQNGRFVRTDEDYNIDLEKTINMNIRHAMFDYRGFNFNYDNTLQLIDNITANVMKAIEDVVEMKKGMKQE